MWELPPPPLPPHPAYKLSSSTWRLGSCLLLPSVSCLRVHVGQGLYSILPSEKVPEPPALPLNPLVVSVYCRKKTKRELVAETVSFHSSESLPLWSGTTALSPLDPSLTIQALSRERRLGWPANHGREATLPL